MDSLYELLPPKPRVFEPQSGGHSQRRTEAYESASIRPQTAGAEARYFDVAPAFEALKGVRQGGGKRYCDGDCLKDAGSLTTR